MQKINKLTLKLWIFLLTLITLTTITSPTVHATCLSNGKCSDNFNPLNDAFTKAGMSSNSNIDSQPVQQQAPQPVQQPIYHAPAQQQVPQSQPIQHNNYVAPAPQPVQHSTYVAPTPKTNNYVNPQPAQHTNYVAPMTVPNVQPTQIPLVEQTQPLQTNQEVNNSNEDTKKLEENKQKDEQVKKELEDLKIDVKNKIQKLSELSSTEKNNFISKLKNLDSKEKVNLIFDKAKKQEAMNKASRLEKEKLAKKKKEDEKNKNNLILWSSIIGGVVIVASITGFIIYNKKINTK